MADSLENNQESARNQDRGPKVHGGARKGAGRKPGSATRKTREIADRAMEEGITPLEFMLQVMREPSDHEDPKVQVAREAMRFEAAKAAAPYMHPRLAAIEHSGAGGGPIVSAVMDVTAQEFAEIAKGVASEV
jgi:hypothetical protein